jgi:hypothetical protein
LIHRLADLDDVTLRKQLGRLPRLRQIVDVVPPLRLFGSSLDEYGKHLLIEQLFGFDQPFNSYGSSLRRPRSTATPPSKSVKPLAADAGSISGARAGDVQTPGFILLPVAPQAKRCGGCSGNEAVQVSDIATESPPTPPMSELVAVSVRPPKPP